MLTSRFFLFLPNGTPVHDALIRDTKDTLAGRGLDVVVDRPAWLFAQGPLGRSSELPPGNGYLLDIWAGTRQSPLSDRLASGPEDLQSRIDLATQTLMLPTGQSTTFPIDDFSKTCLLNGVDELGYILGFADQITAFEARNGIAIIST